MTPATLRAALAAATPAQLRDALVQHGDRAPLSPPVVLALVSAAVVLQGASEHRVSLDGVRRARMLLRADLTEVQRVLGQLRVAIGGPVVPVARHEVQVVEAGLHGHYAVVRLFGGVELESLEPGPAVLELNRSPAGGA